MKEGYFQENWNDDKGRPTGGVSFGSGFTVSWQNGPLGRDAERKIPNGAFVEDVIQVVIDRLDFYQASGFSCDANAIAIEKLKSALFVLNERTKEREARKVEGTHAV